MKAYSVGKDRRRQENVRFRSSAYLYVICEILVTVTVRNVVMV
jgi:hypothetical protein